MTHENHWAMPDPHAGSIQDEIRPVVVPPQVPRRPFSERLTRFWHVFLFAFKRALPTAGLIMAMTFVTMSYIRIERADASMTFAYFKAEQIARLGQLEATIPITDKRGRTHRLPARDIIAHRDLAALSEQTRQTLFLHVKIAALLGALTAVFSISRTVRRVF